jgi:outer membrane lipoprotein-sorting protein
VLGLNDVLALMSQASDSFRTLRATIRHWRDEEKALQAWDRHWEAQAAAGGRSSTIVLSAGSDEPGPATSEATVRVWVQRPGRLREEYEGAWGDQTTVSDGRTLWRRMPRTGLLREDAAELEGVSFATRLLEPGRLLAGIDLELIDEAEQAGRTAVRARALPRNVTWHDLFGLAPGADQYELLIDTERGVLLRAAAFLEGDLFASSEVLEIAFDEELASELFILEPAPGEEVRTPADLTDELPEDLTLDEAASRASFTLWTPRGLGRDWEINVSYASGEREPLERETAMLNYWHEEKGQLSINETRRDEERGKGWELLHRDGEEFRVWQREGRRRMPILVRFHRGETSIELQSDDFALERLLAIAASFAPVSHERPRFFR